LIITKILRMKNIRTPWGTFTYYSVKEKGKAVPLEYPFWTVPEQYGGQIFDDGGKVGVS